MSEILAKHPLPVKSAERSTANNDEKAILKDINYFNRSSNMRRLKKDLEVNKKIKKFQDKVADILAVIDTFQCEHKIETVFMFVMQSAEDYFDPQNDDIKKSVCRKMLMKYVNNDAELYDGFYRLTEKNVKKSTPMRRLKKKTGKFFNVLLPTS